MYKIEKNIPIEKTTIRSPIKDTLNLMEVWDSVIVGDTKTVSNFYIVSRSIWMKTKSAKIDGWYRIWRIS